MENKKECKHKWVLNPYRQSGKVVKDCKNCNLSNIFVCTIDDYNIISKNIEKYVYKENKKKVLNEVVFNLKEAFSNILENISEVDVL